MDIYSAIVLMGLVLSDCSVAERRIIIEVSKAVKCNLREYIREIDKES